MSEAKCETGWGEVARRSAPHPVTHLAWLDSAPTLPLQGRVSNAIKPR
jgi:hypothetical protein